jgi:hypothetical protein
MEKNILTRILPVFALAMLGFAPTAHAQCKHLAIVVNKGNTTENLTVSQLRRLLIGDVRTWPDNKPVTIVAPPPQSQIFHCLLTEVARMSESEYKRHLANVEFRGEQPLQLRIFDRTTEAEKIVSGSTGSLAILEAESATAALGSSVRILSVNGKHPGDPGYPL